MSDDLAGAIVAAFAADATLPTLATAIYDGQAAEAARMPYLVFEEAGTRPAFNYGPGYYEHHHVRFRCFARSEERAGDLAEAVLAALNLKPEALDFASGYAMSCRWTGGHSGAGHVRGRDSERAWERSLDFRITVGRTRP